MSGINNLFRFSPLKVALGELFEAITEASFSENEMLGIIPHLTKVSLKQAAEMLRLPKLRLKASAIFLSSSTERSEQTHSSAKPMKKISL